MEDTDVLPVAIATTIAEPTCVQIRAAEPCNSVSTGLQCEMDPVSQTQAGDVLSSLGFSVVGWYHSHPTFHPNPSVRDINTQDQFQVKETQQGRSPRARRRILIVVIAPELLLTRRRPLHWDDRQPVRPSEPFSALSDNLFVGESEPGSLELAEYVWHQRHPNAANLKSRGCGSVFWASHSVFLSVLPRAALQIWFQIVARRSRLGTDDEESSVDHPQILPISSVSAK